MKRFIKSLQFIFKPRYWIMNEKYNPTWDKLLNELLDKYNFIVINKYIAKLGPIEIWIANQPYSTMQPFNRDEFRASRLTIQRAIRKLHDDYLTQLQDDYEANC